MQSSKLRCPDTNQLYSIQALKPNLFGLRHKNLLSSNPDTEIKASSIHHTVIKSISTAQKPSEIRSPHTKLSYFRPTTEIKSISIPTLNSSQFSCLDAKNNLISIQTLRSRHFRPTDKTESIPIATLESGQVRPPI